MLKNIPNLPSVVADGEILDVLSGKHIVVKAHNGHIGETGYHVLSVTADRKGYYNGTYNIKTHKEAFRIASERRD